VDICEAGVCVGSNDVACTASDQCHDVGTCDTDTGDCNDPAKDDGTTCDDDNACTEDDICTAGVCEAGTSILCPASDDCHTVGTCDATTGICSDPAKVDGTSCSDGDACTQSDTCDAGVCTGASPVACTALDSCHTIGICDTTTGTCSDPVEPDGTVCDTDYECESGVCEPAKEWTVMAYIMADNNLEEHLTGDIGHMLANAWGSTDEVNIIWEIDFYPGFHNNSCYASDISGPCAVWRTVDYTSHVRWFWNANSATHLETLPEASDTIDAYHDFMVWGMTNYPAKKYVVLFWDHGGGYIFGEDDTGGTAYMTNTEIREGIKTGMDDAGIEKIDLLVLYACLMATYESLLEFGDLADYYVASEESIYGFRWNWLGDLHNDPTVGPLDISQYFVDHFLVNYATPGQQDTQTISVWDFSHRTAFIDAWEDLVGLMSDNLADIYITLALAQVDAQHYQTSQNCPLGQMQDIGGMMDYLIANIDGHPDIVNAAQTVRDLVDDLTVILDNGLLYGDSTGISIYFPEEKCHGTLYSTLGPLHDLWLNFLEDFYAVFEEDTTPPDFASDTMVQTGSGFTWSGQLDPATSDLKSLFWGWAKFMDTADSEGGWMWLQGQEPIDYAADFTFSFEYDLKNLVVYDGDTCEGAGSNLCAWGLIYDREYTSPNSDLLTIPMWHNDNDWVKWYGSYDYIQQKTTTADYYLIDEEVASALEPLPGSTFNALYLAKYAYSAYPALFLWGINETLFDGDADMEATYVDADTQLPMVYILRATDIFDNQTTILRCSGASNTFLIDVIVDGIQAGTGAVYPHDPGGAADFLWRMWKNGTLFYNSPWVLDEHKAQFRAFITANPGDTFWFGLYEVDPGVTNTVYTNTTTLTTLVNNARAVGFWETGGLVGTFPLSANITIAVRECLNYGLENGLACDDGDDCTSGNCYEDSDGDGYDPGNASPNSTCRAAPQGAGVDCDDNCDTCFPGSSATTSETDLLDQNCDGNLNDYTGVLPKVCNLTATGQTAANGLPIPQNQMCQANGGPAPGNPQPQGMVDGCAKWCENGGSQANPAIYTPSAGTVSPGAGSVPGDGYPGFNWDNCHFLPMTGFPMNSLGRTGSCAQVGPAPNPIRTCTCNGAHAFSGYH